MDYIAWIMQSLFALVLFFLSYYVNRTTKKLEETASNLQKAITANEVHNKEISIINRDMEIINKRLNSHSSDIKELQKGFQSCKHCNK